MQSNELNDLKQLAIEVLINLTNPNNTISEETMLYYIDQVDCLDHILLSILEIDPSALQKIFKSDELIMLSYVRYYIIPLIGYEKGKATRISIYDSIILNKFISIHHDFNKILMDPKLPYNTTTKCDMETKITRQNTKNKYEGD